MFKVMSFPTNPISGGPVVRLVFPKGEVDVALEMRSVAGGDCHGD